MTLENFISRHLQGSKGIVPEVFPIYTEFYGFYLKWESHKNLYQDKYDPLNDIFHLILTYDPKVLLMRSFCLKKNNHIFTFSYKINYLYVFTPLIIL